MATYTGVTEIRVHPGIGVARVGNSQPTSAADRDFFFLGPEAPNAVPADDFAFKDATGALKRQAQRFRVFGYDASGGVVGEIASGDTVNGAAVNVEWTAHLRNLKAANYAFQGQYGFDPTQLRNSTVQPGLNPEDRDQLIIDPGAKTLAGASQGPVELLDDGDGGSTIFDSDPGQLSGLLRFDPPQNAGAEGQVPVTYTPAQVSLGKLYTDDAGRLIVVGGEGRSESCTTPAVVISKVTEKVPDPNPEYNGNSYFNNPGWFDDTAGGSVEAALLDASTGQPVAGLATAGDPAKRGWVAVAPPKYSPYTDMVVSLLDLQLDLFPEADPYDGQGVNFYRDIYPILKIATDYAWTNERAFHGHKPGSLGGFLRPEYLALLADPSASADNRSFIFKYLRPPSTPTPGVPPPPGAAPPPSQLPTPATPQSGSLMPKLFGNGGSPSENQTNKTAFPNQWLSLTPHQYAKFEKWAAGDFVMGDPSDQRWADLPAPQALDFAALQPTVGGGFHPGIELTYMMGLAAYFDSAFRFSGQPIEGFTISPGSVAAYMSVPWQGDFWSCNISWWPALRPDIVVEGATEGAQGLRAVPWFRSAAIPPHADSVSGYNDGYATMVEDWPRFGVVRPISPQLLVEGEVAFHEDERDPTLTGPTRIAAATADHVATGNALAAPTPAAGQPVTVAAASGDAAQQWTLVPYSASPTTFFVAAGDDASGPVLAADTSGAVTLQARASPADDGQLWEYVPSGYPGVFTLRSQRTVQALTAGAVGAPVTTAAATPGAVQLWTLEAD